MQSDDSLYKAFLEEMSSLENFRMTYAAAHPSIPLDRDDPDVRRLIEAMAFFAARARLAAVSNVVASRRRIFQQFFSYLLTPLPAMGMLQARPTGQFGEPVSLPPATEVALSPETGGMALFRTLHPLRILPLSLLETRMLLLPNQGYRLLLRLETPYPRNDEIGRLSFYINHLNDFHTSLRVFHTLKTHLIRSSAVFDEKATETTPGIPCEVSFGQSPDLLEEEAWEESLHPLQRERLFFHFPQQELYLHLQIPSTPRNWRQVTLCLDLDAKWPRNLTLNREVFQLFVVPLVNLRRAMAQPLLCDGTQERYAIRHPEMEYGFELHSVLGVYEVRKKGGMAPLRAGILSGGNGSYEIEESLDRGSAKRHWLTLHFPEAFQDPKTLAIDLLWLQPWFSEAIPQKQQIALYRRNIVGVRWELVGDPVPHEENRFLEEMEGFMHLLTLTNKAALNFEDLCAILQTLGNVSRGSFQQAFQQLTGVRVEGVPQQAPGMATRLKHVYFLRFRELDPGLRPQMEAFVAHVGRVLDAWISGATVEVRMEVSEERARPAIEGRNR